MSKTSLICSMSFGKDSLAMTLELLKRGENVLDIVYFDTGWEFPQMEGVVTRFEKVTGRKVTRLRPRLSPLYKTSRRPIDFMFADYPVKSRKTGEIHRIVNMRECPALPVAREIYKKHCMGRPEAKK